VEVVPTRLRFFFPRSLRTLRSAHAQRGRHSPRHWSPDAGAWRAYLPGPTKHFLRHGQCQGRHALDGDATIQKSLADIWRAEAIAWLVGYYLLMPDHLHFCCAPHHLHFEIDRWVEFWKSLFRRRHVDQPWAWQRKSFHHRLRNRIEYEDKLNYVRENPLRKQLVLRPDDWPYQGRIHDLKWTAD